MKKYSFLLTALIIVFAVGYAVGRAGHHVPRFEMKDDAVELFLTGKPETSSYPSSNVSRASYMAAEDQGANDGPDVKLIRQKYKQLLKDKVPGVNTVHPETWSTCADQNVTLTYFLYESPDENKIEIQKKVN